METTDFLKAIRSMRIIVVVTIVAAFTTCLVFALLFFKTTKDKGDNIYVSTQAGTFLAKRNEYGQRYDFEVNNHVRVFFQNLLEGDQFTFTKNVESALCLIDNVNGKKLYEQLQKGGFYDLYKKENAHTAIAVDSIKVKMSESPYKAKIWLKQSVYWAGYSKAVPYCAIMDIVEDNRSEKNPFGLMITNLAFVEYNIQTTSKDSLR